MSTPEAENLPYTVIFGKVKTKKSSYFGLFTIILQNSKKELENALSAFSVYSQVHETKLEEGWSAFEQKIQDMIYSGDLAPSVSMTTQDSLREEFRLPEFNQNFYEHLIRNDLDEINVLLHTFFDRVLHDEIDLEFKLHQIDSEELAQGRNREEQNKSQENAHEPGTVLLSSKLVIAPVGGKLVTEIKTGDQIMITLENGPKEAPYIAELNLKKENGQIKPCAVRISGVKPLEKGVQVTGQILENVYTIINEEEKVLVKLFAPEAKSAAKSNDLPKTSSAGSARPKPLEPAEKNGFPVKILISVGLLVLLLAGLAFLLISG